MAKTPIEVIADMVNHPGTVEQYCRTGSDTFEKCHDDLVKEGTDYRTMYVAWLMTHMRAHNRNVGAERFTLVAAGDSALTARDALTGKVVTFKITVE